jgi:glyoxylase-like metal-dependent hydrolase (beta-lactamase superfamily II)
VRVFQQLIGVIRDEITRAVNSRYHFDHVGGNNSDSYRGWLTRGDFR